MVALTCHHAGRGELGASGLLVALKGIEHAFGRQAARPLGSA